MFWIVVIILVVWFLATRSNKTAVVQDTSTEEEPKQNNISEESVFKTQTNFEEKLRTEVDFPDSIGRSERYIYWKLMRPWYDKLSSENRYNDEMIQRFRNDWLDYMDSLQDHSTCHYLSMEMEADSEKEKSYREEAMLTFKKFSAIQDGFAAAVGKEAVDELTRIRDLEFSALNSRGELAPEGFEYDFSDKLKKKKRSS